MTVSTNTQHERTILQDWLAAAIPDAGGLTVTALSEAKGGGWSARILFAAISYTSAGTAMERRLVVRFLPDYLLFLGTTLENQWRFCEAMGRHSAIPVPGIIGVEND